MSDTRSDTHSLFSKSNSIPSSLRHHQTTPIPLIYISIPSVSCCLLKMHVERANRLNLANWSIKVNSLRLLTHLKMVVRHPTICTDFYKIFIFMHTAKDLIPKWSKWTNWIIWWVCVKITGIIICYLQLGTTSITTWLNEQVKLKGSTVSTREWICQLCNRARTLAGFNAVRLRPFKIPWEVKNSSTAFERNVDVLLKFCSR